jgi:hypothetical protein
MEGVSGDEEEAKNLNKEIREMGKGVLLVAFHVSLLLFTFLVSGSGERHLGAKAPFVTGVTCIFFRRDLYCSQVRAERGRVRGQKAPPVRYSAVFL